MRIVSHIGGSQNLKAITEYLQALEGKDSPFPIADLVKIVSNNGGSHNLKAITEYLQALDGKDSLFPIADLVRVVSNDGGSHNLKAITEYLQTLNGKNSPFLIADLVRIVSHIGGSHNLKAITEYLQTLEGKHWFFPIADLVRIVSHDGGSLNLQALTNNTDIILGIQATWSAASVAIHLLDGKNGQPKLAFFLAHIEKILNFTNSNRLTNESLIAALVLAANCDATRLDAIMRAIPFFLSAGLFEAQLAQLMQSTHKASLLLNVAKHFSHATTTQEQIVSVVRNYLSSGLTTQCFKKIERANPAFAELSIIEQARKAQLDDHLEHLTYLRQRKDFIGHDNYILNYCPAELRQYLINPEARENTKSTSTLDTCKNKRQACEMDDELDWESEAQEVEPPPYKKTHTEPSSAHEAIIADSPHFFFTSSPNQNKRTASQIEQGLDLQPNAQDVEPPPFKKIHTDTSIINFPQVFFAPPAFTMDDHTPETESLWALLSRFEDAAWDEPPLFETFTGLTQTP